MLMLARFGKQVRQSLALGMKAGAHTYVLNAHVVSCFFQTEVRLQQRKFAFRCCVRI
jgi:hypothetical protein